MPALPWYHIASDFSTHTKTRHLCALLHDVNAGMYVVRLMEHCATHAQDGRLQEFEIEDAAGWKKRTGTLLGHLITARFLEKDGDSYLLHGWEERNGARIRKAIRDAKKPRGNKPCPAPVPRGTAEGQPGDAGGILGGDVEVEVDQKLAKPRWPLLVRFNAGVAEGGCWRTVPIVGRDKQAHEATAAAEIERHLSRLGVEFAIAMAVERVREGAKPKALSYWLPMLRELEAPPVLRAVGECPKPTDPDFNDPNAWPSMQAFYNRDAGRAA